MNDDLKQDFETAIVRHLLFKSKLRSFLYGSATAEEPIRDSRVCALGRWITEHAQGPYRQLDEFQELDRVHRQVHQMASRLMDLRLAGQADQAIAGLADVQVLADRITQLLHTMEEKLRHSR